VGVESLINLNAKGEFQQVFLRVMDYLRRDQRTIPARGVYDLHRDGGGNSTIAQHRVLPLHRLCELKCQM